MKKKVSVHIITYNHEKFISKCLAGTVSQKTNFDYEIIIGDDCSEDGTRKILTEYKNRYPDLIKLILFEKRNAGLPGKINFLTVYDNCNGEYIAFCEGDDYWCDENKLQKQVDFLEANPDFAICYHRVLELQNEKLIPEDLNSSETEETYNIEKLAQGNFIHTPSVLFRNGLFKTFPEWFKDSPAGDYVLHMLNAGHGLIKYMPEQMAVYRKHNGSVWSSQKSEKIYEEWINVLNLLLNEKFSRQVIENLKEQKRSTAEKYLRFLMKNKPDIFLNKLELLGKEDTYLKDKWLLEYFPSKIAKLEKELDLYKNHWLIKLGRKIRRR